MSGKSRLVILTNDEIEKKLNRLACQILENHTTASLIQFVGLNERGYALSRSIINKIKSLSPASKTSLFQGHSENQVEIEGKESLKATEPIIIVDDVLNTGRSVYYVLADLASIKPAQMEICVLADRHHKKFPIHPNYVGLTFATTVQEHIYFDSKKPELYLN